MLQKIVNGIAIASGVVSITVVGVAGYVFIRKDAIIDNIKSKVMESVLPGGLGSALGSGGLGGALDMPDLGGNPMATPDAPSRQAEPTAPVLPLGF
jgi:hypothetical protein